jgi:ribonuclease PH
MTRLDRRQPDQCRPARITSNYVLTAEGSALIEIGHTRVICTATVEDTVPQFLRGSGKGWVTAEYSMLPRATVTRTQRDAVKGRPSGRVLEIQRLIGRSLRAVTDLQALGERSVIIDCDVVQADGGTRCASITGGFVALALAMKQMAEAKILARAPLTDYLAATSVGVLDGTAILDLCYEEDSRAEVDMNVVMTGSGRFVEVQATAEHSTFDHGRLQEMLALAEAGIRELVAAQRRMVQW